MVADEDVEVSQDVTGAPGRQEDEGPPFDVDALAAALRWTIGRSPRQSDPAADRRLLRAVAARLGPDVEPTPTALDAHLVAVLSDIAAGDELADHAEPRHRDWIRPIGRIYLCPPEDLPADLQRRIGSDTVLQHLGDGVTSRARAAGRILGVAPNAVRVRREPVLLQAAAAALLARIEPARSPGPVVAPVAPVAAATAEGVVAPDEVVEPSAPRRVRSRRAVGAGIAALVVVLGLVVVALVVRGGDGDEQDAAEGEREPAPSAIGPIPVADGAVVLGLRGGDLLALADGTSTDLGLDDVVAADAHRHEGAVHVVAQRGDGRLVYGALGAVPGRWVDLGAGHRDPEVGIDRTGRPVVVAVAGGAGDLARRPIDADGRPDGDWQPLAATGAVDIDLVTNHDGRLEVGGLSGTGAAFNIWQTGAPGGWSNYSDTRAGEDGRRIQAVANLDGRLELFVERADGTLWNTWQEAPGRSWRTGWDPRYLEDLRDWRVAVGADGHLVVVALGDDGVRLRRQVRVPQADGTTKLMWPPSTVVEELDPLGGPVPDAVTLVTTEDAATVVATGDGRTVAVDVGPEGPGAPRPLAPTAVDALVPVDG